MLRTTEAGSPYEITVERSVCVVMRLVVCVTVEVTVVPKPT